MLKAKYVGKCQQQSEIKL